MAKILLPIEQYSEDTLRTILDLFSEGKRNLFIGMYAVCPYSIIGRTGKWKYGIKDYVFSLEGSPLQISTDELPPECVQKFQWDAQKLALNYDVHYTNEYNWPALKEEGKYANLLVFNSSDTFINHSLKEILSDKDHCPLLFLPESISTIDHIIVPLLEEGSINVIRDFQNLFEELSSTKLVTVLNRLPENQEDIRREKYLVELLKSNFKNVSINWFLTQNIDEEIMKLSENKGRMLAFDKSCLESIEIIETLVEKNSISVLLLS